MTNELEKSYEVSNLKRMRNFLSLLSLVDNIDISINQQLSYRNIRNKIKTKEYKVI